MNCYECERRNIFFIMASLLLPIALGVLIGWYLREIRLADETEKVSRAYDHAIESYREARHEIERAKRGRR